MNHSSSEYEGLVKSALQFVTDGPSMTASDRDGVRDMAQTFATLAVAAAQHEANEIARLRLRAGA